jgi:hypothetical protein
MKVSFFENEFEEHNKGRENYQESPEQGNPAQARKACGTGRALPCGHHCAQPILRRFGVESTVRPSLALYNACEEIDALVAAPWNLKQGHGSL